MSSLHSPRQYTNRRIYHWPDSTIPIEITRTLGAHRIRISLNEAEPKRVWSFYVTGGHNNRGLDRDAEECTFRLTEKLPSPHPAGVTVEFSPNPGWSRYSIFTVTEPTTGIVLRFEMSPAEIISTRVVCEAGAFTDLDIEVTRFMTDAPSLIAVIAGTADNTIRVRTTTLTWGLGSFNDGIPKALVRIQGFQLWLFSFSDGTHVEVEVDYGRRPSAQGYLSAVDPSGEANGRVSIKGLDTSGAVVADISPPDPASTGGEQERTWRLVIPGLTAFDIWFDGPGSIARKTPPTLRLVGLPLAIDFTFYIFQPIQG